ncbi:ester cyclase [Haloarcula sp. 1CSR25-25]|nr:ester cyclase [Haloarcula sp. 1CSR25-25]
MGVPTTGNRVETTDIVIFRLDDGQIVEERTMDDIFGLL